MAPVPHASFLALIGAGAFLAWRLAVRIGRLLGRQRIAPAWPWLVLLLFPGLLVFVFMLALATAPAGAAALFAGAAGGGAFSFVGLRLTRFEAARDGDFYTPNAPIGLVLAALLVGRLLYRAWALYGADFHGGALVADVGRSPLTLGVFGLAAGYYAGFAGGLLHWRYRRSIRDIPAPPVDPR